MSSLHASGRLESRRPASPSGALAVFGPDSWGDSEPAPAIAQPPAAAFLSAAHEIRSPLAWMSGALENLSASASGLDAEAARLLAQIRGMCGRMQRTVEDCFAFGRLESGAIAYQPALVDVNALMLELAATWRSAFARNGIAFGGISLGAIPLLPCDPHKVQRVVANLLENALKFTPAGGEVELLWRPCVWAPTAAVTPGPEPPRANAVCISVHDTGPGIAPEHQQEIFEPFVSLSRGAADRHEETRSGMGLGLAVAHRLVRWHGGKLWVESTPGEGSTFAVMLPIRSADEPSPHP